MQKNKYHSATRGWFGTLRKELNRWLYAPAYANGYRIYFR
jgi:hypothetical protein